MLKIGIFSKLSRVSIRMLRYYDDQGLLVPMQIDPITGYRYYSEDQLTAAERIASLRRMGFSLAEVRELLSQADCREVWEEALERQRKVLQEQEREARHRLSVVLPLDFDDERAVGLFGFLYDLVLRSVTVHLHFVGFVFLPDLLFCQF